MTLMTGTNSEWRTYDFDRQRNPSENRRIAFAHLVFSFSTVME